eukprot:g600.t1
MILKVNPDVLALQGIPSGANFLEYAEVKRDFVDIATAKSLDGSVKLLTRRHLQSYIKTFASIGPAVVMKLQTSANSVAFVASMSLSPFAINAKDRKMEIENVLSWCRKHANVSLSSSSLPSSSLPGKYYGFLCGQMNLRTFEDKLIEAMPSNVADCTRLYDAWKTFGSPSDAKYTWDSFSNKFEHTSLRFRSRFERIITFDASGALRPNEFYLVGNKPLGKSTGHFLTSNFGVLANFDISDEKWDKDKGGGHN